MKTARMKTYLDNITHTCDAACQSPCPLYLRELRRVAMDEGDRIVIRREQEKRAKEKS